MPITDSAEGHGSSVGALAVGTTSPVTWPTPNAMLPAVRCPSVLDTTRKVTV